MTHPTAPMRLKPFNVPNFATAKDFESVSIPVKELPEGALNDLARQWLKSLYAQAGKPSPWGIDT